MKSKMAAWPEIGCWILNMLIVTGVDMKKIAILALLLMHFK